MDYKIFLLLSQRSDVNILFMLSESHVLQARLLVTLGSPPLTHEGGSAALVFMSDFYVHAGFISSLTNVPKRLDKLFNRRFYPKRFTVIFLGKCHS